MNHPIASGRLRGAARLALVVAATLALAALLPLSPRPAAAVPAVAVSPVSPASPDGAAGFGIGFWLTSAAGAQPAAAPPPFVPLGGIWTCIRQHESGGNYSTNTGNGYYGAYQFSLPTWRAVGGQGLPSQASPAEQDGRALMLQQRAGWGQWSTARGCGA